MSKFWDKVEACEHRRQEATGWFSMCATPYCGDISESHCRDCGVFIVSCDCMSNYSMSGWPESRWRNYERRKKQSRLEEGTK